VTDTNTCIAMNGAKEEVPEKFLTLLYRGHLIKIIQKKLVYNPNWALN